MVDLRKTGANQYDVLSNGQVIGQVWNWHGSWSAKTQDTIHHNLKSRKDAIARVEHTQRPKP